MGHLRSKAPHPPLAALSSLKTRAGQIVDAISIRKRLEIEDRHSRSFGRELISSVTRTVHRDIGGGGVAILLPWSGAKQGTAAVNAACDRL